MVSCIYGVKFPRLEIELCWDYLDTLRREIEAEAGDTEDLEYALDYLEDHSFYFRNDEFIFGIDVSNSEPTEEETEELKELLRKRFNCDEEPEFYYIYLYKKTDK